MTDRVDEPAWGATRALGRATTLVTILVLFGVVLGRPDLVLMAVPFALGAAWALRRRPDEVPGVELVLPGEPAAEGATVQIPLRLSNTSSAAYDVVVTRLSHSPWLRIQHGDRPYGIGLPAGEAAEVVLAGPALRWGVHGVGPAEAYAVACDGLLLSTLVETGGADVRVHPVPEPFRAQETMPRSAMLVGVHRSRRTGEGGELAGVRPYGPGDRLRRVDWRVTLRTRELHVAQTLSDRDAAVVVLLDVLHEAGRSQGIHGSASVLDRTVRSAAAIAEHYLRQGDRVALVEYSGSPRYLRAASGRRQLQAVLEWLLHVRARVRASETPAFGIDPHLIPSSALVVVLTPLLAPQSAEMVATLSRAGRVVVAVDTLGNLADLSVDETQWTVLARRLWQLDRANTIGQLREAGVPVTPWVGPGSLDEVLRDMARLASAPRLAVR
ncbi:MAG TPA: DUF58 domain-containing protein [Micromonosporaceae bacterium]|nr:DUF58 domain-containing protein [Micromonosporaceae bacterium]